jgi:hypothetical protein
MIRLVALLPSEGLHRGVKHIAHTPLRPDEFGRAGIDLQLPAQPQDLNVDAPIEYLLVVEMRGGEQLLPAQHLLRRPEKCGQKTELANGDLN